MTNTNHELNNFNNWLKSNKLSINTEKTKFILFHKYKHKSPTRIACFKN